jgi:hypothetical protein
VSNPKRSEVPDLPNYLDPADHVLTADFVSTPAAILFRCDPSVSAAHWNFRSPLLVGGAPVIARAQTQPLPHWQHNGQLCGQSQQADYFQGQRLWFPRQFRQGTRLVPTFAPSFCDGGLVLQDSYPDAANEPVERFHWRPALVQSFEFSLVEHGFRLATDHYARLWFVHKPFWHDWLASVKREELTRWGDGDDFVVNYIGHPLQGAVSGYIQIQNDPRGRAEKIGHSKQYWESRLKATVWAAVYSAQLEAGPILSETAIGNEGGHTYALGNKPPTNGTGLVDWVVTPVIGLGWILVEDTLEKYLVDRLAGNNPVLKYKILLGALSPGRSMANMLQGKVPWYRYLVNGQPFEPVRKTPAKDTTESASTRYRREIGWHYANVNLPMDLDGCFGCRVHNSGLGANFDYRISRRFGFDSEINLFPGSWGIRGKSRTVEGLFGIRYGFRQQKWGVFAKLRPGFVYYDKARPELNSQLLGNLTRFAFDVGQSFEYYPSRRSTFRLDIGTTFVRYLRDNHDPTAMFPLSSRYFITQGNFQFSSGYILRF